MKEYKKSMYVDLFIYKPFTIIIRAIVDKP